MRLVHEFELKFLSFNGTIFGIFRKDKKLFGKKTTTFWEKDQKKFENYGLSL